LAATPDERSGALFKWSMAADGLPLEMKSATTPKSSTAASATIFPRQYMRGRLGRHPTMEVTDGTLAPLIGST
tara:strand:+ start:357 stop:575 length:219 start_codon:yes stop_codon:yes gene_type:complete